MTTLSYKLIDTANNHVKDDNTLLNSPAVLVQFPQGIPQTLQHNENNTNKYNNNSAINFELYNNTDNRKLQQRVLIGYNDNSVYVGKNYGEHNYKNNLQQHIVGLYDEQHNTLKLYNTLHVYSLQQNIINQEDGTLMNNNVTQLQQQQDNIKSEVEQSTEEKQQEYIQSRELLIETYGSKKRKRDLRSAAANKVTMNDSVNDVLNNTLNQVHNTPVKKEIKQENDNNSTTTTPTSESSNNTTGILPQHDSTTDDVDKIYDVYNIIGVSAWEALVAKVIIDACHKPSSNTHLTQFVSYRALQLTVYENDIKTMKIKSKILLYIDKVIKFSTMHPSKKQYEVKHHKYLIPHAVQEQLLNDFCIVQQGETDALTGQQRINYIHNNTMKTKMYLYLVVLSLIACNYVLQEQDIKLLAGDLKITIPTLITYAREVGCVNASKTTIQLKAPLTLPELRNRRMSRR